MLEKMFECFFTSKEKQISLLTSKIKNIKKNFEKIKFLLKQKFTLRGKVLMSQQIHEEAKRRKEENVNFYLDETTELKENIEKKDSFMKQFEKKFFEVEIFVQRESKLNQLERFRKFHYYEILAFVNNNGVFQYRKSLLNEEISNIKSDVVKIIDENLQVKRNICNPGVKRKKGVFGNQQTLWSECEYSYRDFGSVNSNNNNKDFSNNNFGGNNYNFNNNENKKNLLIVEDKNLNYKKIEDSYNKKILFLARKNEHLKAKYQNLIMKMNNFNHSEFANLIINHRQTLINFGEKNELNLNLLNINRKNSLGINFILGAYKKPLLDKSINKFHKIEENEEYSFIRESKIKSNKNSKKANDSNKKVNCKNPKNDDLKKNKSKGSGSKKDLYQVYHTEGDYNCNHSARSKDIENNEDYVNGDIYLNNINNDNNINNYIQVKISKKVFNKKPNFSKKENAADAILHSERKVNKFSSDKNQINLKLLKRIQPLESKECSFEFIKQEETELPKTPRIIALSDKVINIKKFESSNKKNSLFSKSYLEEEKKNNFINLTINKNEIPNQQQQKINKAEEKIKINILKAKNEIKKIEQLQLESNNENNVNSGFNSENVSDSDQYKENNIAYENCKVESFSANGEISFNKDSPAFNNCKKQSNAKLNQNSSKLIKIHKQFRKNKCKSFEKTEINLKRIFNLYNISYDNSAVSDDSSNESNKSKSQWNSESFNNSNNFYFDDFESHNKKQIEIQKKILIPTLKLIAIKSLDTVNLINDNFFHKNNNKNIKYNEVNDFTLEKESEYDDFAFEGKIDFIPGDAECNKNNDDNINFKKTNLNQYKRKNTLNLSPIMKPRNSGDVWNLSSFNP